MSELRVVYFCGEPTLRARAKEGSLRLTPEGLRLEEAVIPYADLRSLATERIHHIGTVVRLELPGEPLSLIVPRLNLGGAFVVVNRAATKRLCQRIAEAKRAAGDPGARIE